MIGTFNPQVTKSKLDSQYTPSTSNNYRITRPWYRRLHVNACSIVLVLKVDLVIDGEPNICMKASTKGMKPMF